MDNVLTEIEQFNGTSFLPIYTLFNFTIEYYLNNARSFRREPDCMYSSGYVTPIATISDYSIHVYSFMPEKTLIKIFDLSGKEIYNYVMNNLSIEKKSKLDVVYKNYENCRRYLGPESLYSENKELYTEIQTIKNKYCFDMLNEFIKIGKKYSRIIHHQLKTQRNGVLFINNISDYKFIP